MGATYSPLRPVRRYWGNTTFDCQLLCRGASRAWLNERGLKGFQSETRCQVEFWAVFDQRSRKAS